MRKLLLPSSLRSRSPFNHVRLKVLNRLHFFDPFLQLLANHVIMDPSNQLCKSACSLAPPQTSFLYETCISSEMFLAPCSHRKLSATDICPFLFAKSTPPEWPHFVVSILQNPRNNPHRPSFLSIQRLRQFFIHYLLTNAS